MVIKIWNATYLCGKWHLYTKPNNMVSIQTRFMCIICRYDCCKGVPFLILAGKRIGTAQLAGKKRTPFSKIKIFKRVHFFDFHTTETSPNTNKRFFTNMSWGALHIFVMELQMHATLIYDKVEHMTERQKFTYFKLS